MGLVAFAIAASISTCPSVFDKPERDKGRIAYAVLSFGGFLGMGDKLFAIPWNALALDTVEKRFILNVDKERLKGAPGFDKENWPNMADHAWGAKVFTYHGAKPYWG
jgi:hypothetical protein